MVRYLATPGSQAGACPTWTILVQTTPKIEDRISMDQEDKGVHTMSIDQGNVEFFYGLEIRTKFDASGRRGLSSTDVEHLGCIETSSRRDWNKTAIAFTSQLTADLC